MKHKNGFYSEHAHSLSLSLSLTHTHTHTHTCAKSLRVSEDVGDWIHSNYLCAWQDICENCRITRYRRGRREVVQQKKHHETTVLKLPSARGKRRARTRRRRVQHHFHTPFFPLLHMLQNTISTALCSTSWLNFLSSLLLLSKIQQ